jgi:hypothetical protein
MQHKGKAFQEDLVQEHANNTAIRWRVHGACDHEDLELVRYMRVTAEHSANVLSHMAH